jgi:predicted TPR repeat methyltransferase
MRSDFRSEVMNRSQRRALSKGKKPDGLARLAELHHANGQIDKAIGKYREAIARDPDNFTTHNDLGTVLQQAGRVAEASEHFIKAFRLSPKNAAVALNLAVCLTSQLQFKEAVALYREAVALNPASADAQSGLAFALTRLGDYDAAGHHFREALRLNPLHWTTRVNFGLALVEQGKIVEAFEQAEILAAAEEAADFPHKRFGVLLARAGCADGARHCFERHLALHPGDGEQVAMLLASVGDAVPGRASERQIEQLYDQRARGWDNGASQSGYQAHRLVAGVLAALNAKPIDTVIDAGCGTGLVGELLRANTRHLIGIDMSEAMLAEARKKNLYDELHRGDLLAHLGRPGQLADVVTSAATMIYFGDLNPVFAAVSQCLRPGGLFVFTAFPNDDDTGKVAVGSLDGFAQGGCFRHGPDYVTDTAAAHGFSVACLRRDTHEYVGNTPISGLIVALRREE